MTTIPYENDINLTNQLIWSFLKSPDVSEDNKSYIKKIFSNIEHWNLAYILDKTKHIDWPLMFIKTNIIESINRVLKCTFISKRLCNNWLYIVKKMINYSHLKSKEIN